MAVATHLQGTMDSVLSAILARLAVLTTLFCALVDSRTAAMSANKGAHFLASLTIAIQVLESEYRRASLRGRSIWLPCIVSRGGVLTCERRTTTECSPMSHHRYHIYASGRSLPCLLNRLRELEDVSYKMRKALQVVQQLLPELPANRTHITVQYGAPFLYEAGVVFHCPFLP